MKLGGTVYCVRRLFRDTFDGDMSNWANLNPQAKWSVKDGHLYGEWRTGGSTIWCRPAFEGDVLISMHAETLVPTEADWRAFGPERREELPEGGKNLNLFFLCSGPKGEDMLDCHERLLRSGTGPNGMGEDQYRGYFFTFTVGWARLRYLPGYECVSERKGFAPRIGTVHHLVGLKHGNAIRYYVDGELIHDYHDDDPPTRGQMGIALWRNTARIHDFSVYRILGEDVHRRERRERREDGTDRTE